MKFSRARLLSSIGHRLRKLRETYLYSLGEMASKMDLSKSGYYKNEMGTNFPKLETLNRLQGEYDISMDWLIFNKGPVHFRKDEEELKKAKDGLARFLELEEVMPDLNDLLDHMANDPQLRHQVLLFFYKYKKGNGQAEMEESPGT
ncbi:MAG: helix-turn-helix transcriptional regulator [bacterium]|nr:helix-turn-helix transcriptional regulator [bacterium]